MWSKTRSHCQEDVRLPCARASRSEKIRDEKLRDSVAMPTSLTWSSPEHNGAKNTPVKSKPVPSTEYGINLFEDVNSATGISVVVRQNHTILDDVDGYDNNVGMYTIHVKPRGLMRAGSLSPPDGRSSTDVLRETVARPGRHTEAGFSVSHNVLDVPAVSWRPHHPHSLTVLVYPCHAPGASITTYNIFSGDIIRSRHVSQVDADMGSVTRIRHTPDGKHLIIMIMEHVRVNNYLTRIVVLDAENFSVLSRSRAALIQTCHPECVSNVYPNVSMCSGYVYLPTTPATPPLIHTLPPVTSLKAKCRRKVLQMLPANDQKRIERLIGTMEIPKELKSFLRFH